MVGWLGFEHGRGRVIFFADRHELAQAKRYLDLDTLTRLEPRIEQERFGQIALQLVASQLCTDRRSIEEVVCGTFSGVQEQSRNRSGLAHWKRTLAESVDRLILEGLLSEIDGGRLAAMPFGKAVALSGVLPDTGVYLLRFLAREANDLASLLPDRISPGNVDQLAIRLFTACLRSPEFRAESGKNPTRFLPYPLDRAILVSSKDYGSAFPQRNVLTDSPPFNGAKLAVRWINGETLRGLEKTLPDLSAGMIRDLLRDLAWTLHGMSVVSMAGADARVPVDARPRALRDLVGSLGALSKLPRMMGRLGARIAEGLPDDVLWMSQIGKPSRHRRPTSIAA